MDPQFWPKVFKFSKNGHFAPKMAKIATWKYKIKQILDVNFERFEMVFWKNFQRAKNFILSFFFHFFSFFLYYEHPKGTKNGTKHDHPLVFKKRLMQKVLDLLLNAINVAKNFPTFSLVPSLFPIFFFWMVYQHLPKKTIGKLEPLMRNSQETAFSRVNTAGIL